MVGWLQGTLLERLWGWQMRTSTQVVTGQAKFYLKSNNVSPSIDLSSEVNLDEAKLFLHDGY